MSKDFHFVHTRSKEIVENLSVRIANMTTLTRTQLKNAGIDDEGINNMLNRVTSIECDAMTIHIGKTLGGRKPLFALQPQYIGVTGMKKWYEANRDVWHIEDEYGNKLNWEELSAELIDHNKHNPDALSNLDKHGDYRVIEGYEWAKYNFS